jgi:CHASE2 domain-containing sensor protein
MAGASRILPAAAGKGPRKRVYNFRKRLTECGFCAGLRRGVGQAKLHHCKQGDLMTMHADGSLPFMSRSRRLLRRGLLGAVYLTALLGLIVWEYRDHLDQFTSSCDLESPSPRSELYSAPYRHMLAWATRESASHVAVIAIPEDLDNIQGNLCLARAYVADVIRAVTAQHPAEIVLDKFYSPTVCPAGGAETAGLAQAIEAASVPVVLGESTKKADAETDHACLVAKPQLVFGAANVHYGITRLNLENERIPLTWRVLTSDQHSAVATARDSLAWAAVQGYDPTFASRSHLPVLAAESHQPYARLHLDLPRETSSELLCRAGDAAVLRRWKVDCSGGSAEPAPALLGKVVVIGSEDEHDRWPVVGVPLWGVDLQARYIEDLLTGSFLRALPLFMHFLLFAALVFVIEGLPTLLEAFRPQWAGHRLLSAAFQRRRYAWVIFWAATFPFVTTVLCLLIGFLPPLVVFGDIAFITITRLLFFAAETFETPLVHSHHPKGTP